jgi:hypothetical protein
MQTSPIRIRDDAGVLFAFEVNAQLIGRRLAGALRQVDGVTDVRPRKWWTGSADIHIRFQYQGT